MWVDELAEVVSDGLVDVELGVGPRLQLGDAGVLLQVRRDRGIRRPGYKRRENVTWFSQLIIS